MRLVVLAAVILGGLWVVGIENHWLDGRPVQRLLFLGHSYTYYNDMPAMVEKMSASAGSRVRYDVTMHAFPNASLSDHMRNGKTQSLLAMDDWDKVIVQPENAYRQQDQRGSYLTDGARLLAPKGNRQGAVIVSWAMHDRKYQGYDLTRAEHLAYSASNHRGLASATGAQLIDVARVWEDASAGGLPFSLYKDGNHPSLEGSYLTALVVYAELSGDDPANVTYEPWDLSSERAALLRQRARKSLRE